MAHVDNLRRHFPAVRNVAYLNTGTYGALPDATIEVMKESLAQQLREGRLRDNYLAPLMELRAEVKEQLAALFGGQSSEYAMVDSTTQGLNVVLWGIPLAPGDEILYSNIEHQGVLLPVYLQKQRRGAVVKKFDATLPEEELLAQLQSLFTPRTRLVVTSHVSYETGHRLPIEKIAQLAHRHGAYCLIDGAQAAGTEELNLPATDIDFYSLPGHKWLCGPDGTGALYVRSHLHTVVDQTYAGTHSLQAPHMYSHSGHHIAAESAQRFEHSLTSYVNWRGFLESLKFLRVQVGWDYAYSRIHGLSGHLMDQLLDWDNVRIVTPRDARAGLISFRLTNGSAERFVQAAKDRDIDIRYIPKRDLVRVSCGLYNTEDDIARFMNLFRNPLVE